MAEPELFFRTVRIGRMPGFNREGFEVPQLAPGVNIIYGPNGSGKTTLARSLRHLLWPQARETGHIALDAELVASGQSLRVRIDHGSVGHQLDGRPVDAPRVASRETSDRYVLALDDLLLPEDRGDQDRFAQEIVREAAGGYDLRAAATQCKFGCSPRPASSQRKQVRQAKAQLKDVRDRQVRLTQREQQLAALHQDSETAAQSQRDLRWLERARDLLAARQELQQSQQALAQFPEALTAYRDDDVERYESFVREISNIDAEETACREKLSAAVREQESEQLSAELLTTARLTTCRELLECLKQAEADQRETARRCQQAEAKVERALARLGVNVDPSRLEALDAAAIAKAIELARAADHRMIRRLNATEALSRLPGVDSDSAAARDDELQEASRLCAQWLVLAQPTRDPILRPAVLSGAVWLATAVTVFVLWWYGAWAWAIGYAIVLPVADYLARKLLERGQVERRLAVQRQFDDLDVPPPPHWTVEAVRRYQRELEHRLAQRTLAAQTAARREELQREIKALDAKTDEQQSLAAHLAQLGLTADAEGDPAYLLTWVESLAAWRDAHAEHVTAQNADAAVRADAAQARERLEFELAACEVRTGLPIEELTGAVADLEQRAHRLENARMRRASVDEQMQSLLRRREQTQQNLQALCDRLRIDPDDALRLQELAKMHPEYQRARTSHELTRHEVRRLEGELAERPELCELARDEIERRMAEARAAVERLTTLNRDVGAIENEVRQARAAHDLETALSARDAARDDLLAARQREEAAAVGDVLTDYLRVEQRQRDRPDVFRRAHALFVKITHGRYELDIDDGDPPTLRALDTSTDHGHALDELSSGTRLQLLLAVRVAFVERQETGPRLPLVFDEALGNSDERRAGEMIEAAVEICREGRQLFYLTAQWDEVAKWRTVLERDYPDVPFTVVDLAERRGFSEQERVPPTVDVPAPRPLDIPAPDGHDAASYARALGVPGFDPFAPSGDTHLWYVIDDLQLLYALLKQGINRWGQLEALAGAGGRMPLGDQRQWTRARTAARALRLVASLWRLGQGKPVDRRVLREASAVSERFLDQVTDVAQRVGGDAQRLLAELEEGRVVGFGRKKREQLQAELRESGCLDEAEVPSKVQVQHQVLASLSDALQRGEIDAARLEWLVAVTQPKSIEATPAVA